MKQATLMQEKVQLPLFDSLIRMKTATTGVSVSADSKLQTPVRFNLSNGIPCAILNTEMPAQAKLILRFNHPAFIALHYPVAKLAISLLEEDLITRLSNIFAGEESASVVSHHSVTPDSGSLEVIFPETMLEETIKAIAACIQNPCFSVESARRHKEQLLNNCLAKRGLPRNRASELLMEQLFSNHPCGRALRPEDISSINVEKSFTWLNAVLQAVTPRIYLAVHNIHKAEALLGKTFSVLPVFRGNPNDTYHFVQPEFPGQISGSRIHIEMDSADSASIRIGRRIFGMEHPEYPEARMAMAILGGYFSSRLMARLREHKGYAHGIGAGIRSLSAGSYLFISAEVGSQWVVDALGEIDRELNRLASEPVEKDELVTVLHYLEAGILRQTTQRFSSLDSLATLDQFNIKPGWHQDFILNINSLKPQNIISFMQQYMNPTDLATITCGKSLYV